MVAGTGCQVLIMSVLTLVFACLGFLSPANRGALLSSVLALYRICRRRLKSSPGPNINFAIFELGRLLMENSRKYTSLSGSLS